MNSIMTVDDSNIIRMMIKKILKDHAEVVGEASNGEDAVNAFKDLLDQGRRPDVVFMDFNMEKMDGIQASTEILKIAADQDIILVTALNSPELMRKAIDLGISEFVVKPITDEKILNAFQNITGAASANG